MKNHSLKSGSDFFAAYVFSKICSVKNMIPKSKTVLPKISDSTVLSFNSVQKRKLSAPYRFRIILV